MRKSTSQSPTPRGSPSGYRSPLALTLSPIPKPSSHLRKLSTRPSTSTLRGPKSPALSPQHCDITSTPQSTQSHSLLTKLKTLRNAPDARISPQLAAEVVKTYLLPLFETENRREEDRIRGETFGIGGMGSDTLLSELKLSTKLLAELKLTQNRAEIYRNELAQARVAERTALKDMQIFQAEALAAQTQIRFLASLQSEKLRTSQEKIHNAVFLSSQLRQTQENLRTEEDKSKHFSTLLQEERSKADKLRNRTVELEYTNSLLRMENDIMGDRLKGLYLAVEALMGGAGEKGRMAVELEKWTEVGKELGELMDSLSYDLGSTLQQVESLQGQNAEIVHLRNESLEEKSRLAKLAKDRIQSLQKSLQVQEDECSKLKLDSAKQEKRFQDLSLEFGKIRSKMAQYRQRRKAYGESEERICRNCQKVYIDGENFNWSCRIHQSEYGEDMWWCCGQPAKEAPGCRISRHESKDEDEEEEDLERKEQRRAMQKCAVSEYIVLPGIWTHSNRVSEGP